MQAISGRDAKREDIRIDVDMNLDLSIQEDQKESIRIIKALVSPFSRPTREGGYWGITFVDEDTYDAFWDWGKQKKTGYYCPEGIRTLRGIL